MPVTKLLFISVDRDANEDVVTTMVDLVVEVGELLAVFVFNPL